MVRDLVAELVMGRVCYGTRLSWAEVVIGPSVPESGRRVTYAVKRALYFGLGFKGRVCYGLKFVMDWFWLLAETSKNCINNGPFGLLPRQQAIY